MLNIQTQDGVVFSGRNAKQVVSRMRKDMWSAPDLKQDYMEQVAQTVQQMNGRIIRIDSAKNFIDDLADVGLIRIIE